jgi:nucleoside-diphosphate-sugar epimerase
MSQKTVFVTGATGMVGNLLCRRAIEDGYAVSGLVRNQAGAAELKAIGVQPCIGDLANPESFADCLSDVDIIVNVAAQVGDWGPADLFRQINVVALEKMLAVVERVGKLDRWIQISSLGVYPSRDHFGTDETAPIEMNGFDGYTQTKAEAEVVVKRHIHDMKLPAVILRPGFIYGPGDRHVLPNLIRKLNDGQLKFIGSGEKVLNNTFAPNFVEGILLAMQKDTAIGETFNMHDARLVSRKEFIGTICEYFDKPLPKSVPEWLARMLVKPMEGIARAVGAKSPPLLTGARIKFMANNLDFSMAKAVKLLGYDPQVDFRDGIRIALDAYVAKEKAA